MWSYYGDDEWMVAWVAWLHGVRVQGCLSGDIINELWAPRAMIEVPRGGSQTPRGPNNETRQLVSCHQQPPGGLVSHLKKTPKQRINIILAIHPT